MVDMVAKTNQNEAGIKECGNVLVSLASGARITIYKSLPSEKTWLLAVERWGAATNGFEINEEMLNKAVAHLPNVCPAAAEKAKSYLERIADDKKARLAEFQKSLEKKATAGGNGAKNLAAQKAHQSTLEMRNKILPIPYRHFK